MKYIDLLSILLVAAHNDMLGQVSPVLVFFTNTHDVSEALIVLTLLANSHKTSIQFFILYSLTVRLLVASWLLVNTTNNGRS